MNALLLKKLIPKNRLIDCCFLVALVILSSCNSLVEKKKYTIGFSQCTLGDSWRKTMQKEMERELSFHPEINFIIKDANLSSEKQIEQIQELVDEKVDLLLVSPNQAKPITSIVDKAYRQGIPVIIIDRRTLSNNYTAFVGANNYKVGLNAGAFTNALLKGKGNVLEIEGDPAGSSAAIDRHNGFTDFIKQYPGIKYVTQFNVEGDKDPWPEQLGEFLKTHDDIQLIFATNDRLAYAAYKVCKKVGQEQKISIVGVDGLPGENEGIDLVDKGILKATILYPTGGAEAIQTAVNILEGSSYNKEYNLSTTIIDSTNVRIMKLQNEKLSALQHDIERSQQKIDEQKIITRNQTNIIYTISVSLALALMMGLILFYFLKENKKINTRLASQNEEILTQRNQLIELDKKAREATEAKFLFFTNISHELRTPLTLILGPLEEILTSPKLHFSAKAQLEMVKKNTIRLLRLVNQLMDFRKIEHAKMRLRAREENLAVFVSEITSAFTETAMKKHIAFRVDTKDPGLKVWFDVNMLDKVLFNILSNAFKYTNDQGAITVTVGKDESNTKAVIIIEDSGIGMGPETLEHAFELFYEGNEGATRGTGLGLALSKELITLHHGTITLKSEKWKGTRFEIMLPLGNAHLEENEIEKESNPYHLNYEEAKIYTNELERVPVVAPENTATTTKDYSILLIEDNNEIRTFLKEQLNKTYEIIEAENGNTGLNLAYEIVPDIIISDIMLPGKDGMAITEILKNDIRTSHIPIIILTAKGSMEQQIEGLKLNADAYIVKPFNLQYLEETIRSQIRNRETLKDHYSSELPNEGLKSSTSKKIDRKFVSEFSSIIESNIANENFGVDDICREIGISRVQLYRKVKAVLGYNVNDYILTVRMQKAKYLLLNENLSIAEIAFKVGFSSQAYFSTVFKSKFGVTPKAFKEKKVDT
ncbi:MAG: monosaccharide transporter substrate-binding protein family [Ferruginibacter sp.]|nr:monosaccharide transporter substrate-binding protein family [Ferruginibacter sp.]